MVEVTCTPCFRYRDEKPLVTRIALLLTSGFFIVGGVAHLVNPAMFVQIMPAYLPWHYELVIVSGLCEILGGVLIWNKSIRLLVGGGLILLCVLVFPANVNMAINHREFTEIPAWLLYLRLPLQGVIVMVIYRAITPPRSNDPVDDISPVN